MSKTFLSILNVKSNFISVPYFNYDQKCTEDFNLGQSKLKNQRMFVSGAGEWPREKTTCY